MIIKENIHLAIDWKQQRQVKESDTIDQFGIIFYAGF